VQHDAICTHTQPAVFLQGTLERLHITLSSRKISKRSPQPTSGLRSLAVHEIDNLRGQPDP